MLSEYDELYCKLCALNSELTVQIYDDIILRGCTLPWGYIGKYKDLLHPTYPEDYRYYRDLYHYAACIYEWTHFGYKSLYDHYIVSKFKNKCLKLDDYNQYVYSHIFSTVLDANMYIVSDLYVNNCTPILDRDIFISAINICKQLQSNTFLIQYANHILYRVLSSNYEKDITKYISGYKVYRSVDNAVQCDWIECKDIIYDMQVIYEIYTAYSTSSTINDIGIMYVNKSISDGYYYSKSLYYESNLNIIASKINSTIDKDTVQLIRNIIQICSY